ncbi:MAG: tetratricopeptide repeat protein [Kiritimatiellae bacterium]|nr:tetratricopeptide repeat protein [Kiritimatiellia bacterium]
MMSRQKIDFSHCALWTVAAVLLASSAFAGPMEDARALYNAGKYAEVDEKLGPVLDKRPVPMEALRLSFDASVKAGRPYTAERRYNAMLEKKGEKLPSDVLYRAALVAGEIGKPTVRRDRLVYFLNNEKGWNDNVEAALAFICRDGGDAGHFVRYMEKAPATAANFQLGMDMLYQMRTAKRTADYIEQVGTLLDKFRRDDWRTRVLADCDVFLATPPYPAFRKDLFATLVKFPLQNDKFFLRLAARYPEFNAPLVLDFCSNNKVLLPAAIFRRANGLRTDINDTAAREAYGPKLKAIEGLVTAANEQGALKNPEHLQAFIETVVRSGDVFRDGPAPLYTQIALAQLFAKLATARYNADPESLRKLAAECVDLKAWSADQQKTMMATYPKLFDYRPLVWDAKIPETARKTKDLGPTKQLFAKLDGRHDIKWMCLAYICELGDAPLAKQIVEEEVLTKPLDFDADNLVRYFVSCEAMTAADKTNFLKGLFARTGYTPAWDKLVKFGVNPIKGEAVWKAFVETVKPGAKGSDPLRGSLAALWQLKPGAGNACPPEAFTLAETALKAYNGTFPDAKRPKDSPAIEQVWRKMHELCRNKPDHERLVKLFIARIGKGGPYFGELLAHARDSQNITNSLAVASAAVKAGAMGADDFATYQVPENFKGAILAPYYKDMTPGGAAQQVALNCQRLQGGKRRWPDDIQIREINALLDAHPAALIPAEQMSPVLDAMAVLAATNSYVAKLPFEKLAATFLDQQQGAEWIRAKLVAVLRIAGQGDAAVARYVAGAKKLDPASRYNALTVLCGTLVNNAGTWVAAVNESPEKEEPSAASFAGILRDELLPALKAVPRKSSATLRRFDQVRFTDCWGRLCDRGASRQPESVHKANVEFCREVAARMGEGLQCAMEQWRVHVPLRIGFDEMRKLKLLADMGICAYRVGDTYANHVDANGNNLLAVLQNCKKDEIWEPAHIVASRVSTDNGALNTNLQRMRSDCSTHMPGIYPVDEASPLYPLYVAADELERNNSERSWALLQKNIQTFEREAGRLPANFVAWGVEQLRRQRGKNDANLIKARAIATRLLTNESSLTPELAASLMLTRAECFRDQRNYEAARLEYQSIRNGNYYKGTKAARQAMFRDVDLLIEMGNVGQAESLIEYWISQPDVEVQAQAHYFLARIAFERKDYEETRKQLDSVFELDFTHTDARLLHGKWKLATNNEVDDTDVMIGDIADRTIIRPGQDLKISVSDRNLGVAGDGASIPVVISTKPGGDVELLSLYPSARVPYIFNGAIPTALGPSTSTNRVLEVCGNDEVSYRIEPGFLKARGLTTSEPKTLTVVDDARLAIGAAAPLAEDGKAAADLERQLLSLSTEPERGGHAQVVNNLKPGNPIYVVVRDRDRSVSTGPDTITVDARTSSGDKLDALVLKETAGSTGVFRGAIPTALPPPRAFASDTATGSNPGDTINSKPERSGTWKSVADGKQGKWLEVDTMGSHSISNVAIMLPDPSVVKAIRLTGQLLDESVRLGSLPQEDINSRFGIRYQVAAGRKLNSPGLIRTSFLAKGAVAPKKVAGLAFTPVSSRDATQNAYLSAAMQLPAGQKSVRFHLQAKDTRGRTLAGLWMAIAVDGATVFTGQGNALHHRTVDVDFAPGAHQLEIFFSASYPDDALDILVEDAEGHPTPFPAAWTDPKSSPDLAEFVKDRAVIKRTNGGFQATFAKPARVRSLRWEFLDYTGREIEVQKLYVQDTDGKLIIPVETDYSDALQNDTLEVAPGDHITVTYTDERTSSGEKRIREKSMGSSFNDAGVNFFFEKIEQTRNGNQLNLYNAYRFVPGDMLLLSVIDPDGDVTPEADKVSVRVSTRSGVSAEMTLVEQNRRFHNIPRHVPDDIEGIHGGHFLGQLRTCEVGNTNAPASVLRIAPGDVITLSYFDRENTRPGIPVERKATVMAAQASTPELTLFNTRVEREEDTSYDAKLRLAQIRRRPGNEKIEKLYRDVFVATPMDRAVVDDAANAIPVNVATPLPILVTDSSSARHSASTIRIEAVAGSELEDAENTGRDPEAVVIPLRLGHNFTGFRTKLERVDAAASGTFSGLLRLRLGPPDPSMEIDENAPPELSVNGNDTIRLRVLDKDGKVQIERQLRLCSAAHLALMDSSFSADRNMAHVGERFFVQVSDPDQDTGEDLNEIRVDVTANPRLRDASGKYVNTKVTRQIVLKETLPHSGVFTGMVRPVLFAPNEEIPAVATGGVVTASEDLGDDRLAVCYGDTVHFVYNDEGTIPGREPGPIEISGKVFKGSDGSVRLFSKRFRDPDMAVLVQFRLAECLFESAKEHRRLKQPDKSAEAIEEGKFILEEALRNYPTTAHITQGEFLLANLYHELGMEQKEAADKAKKDGDAAAEAAHRKEAEKLFTEALSRFSAILSTWPDSEFAARAQYHKALCLEMLGDYNRSSEEYVKMTYLYPESPLVGDASIRLATYYYKEEKRYDTAGRIYSNFQKRFPTHEKADRALFMSAQCHMKQAEAFAAKARAEKRQTPAALINDEYAAAVAALDTLIETYRDTAAKSLIAQAMYWAGDASLRAKDYEKSFLYLKRTVFEYPETEWARRARGLLLQESKAFEKLE